MNNPNYLELFQFFYNKHGLTLTDDQLDEIVFEVDKITNYQSQKSLVTGEDQNETDEYEYEMFFDSHPGERVQMHGWYPIATERIKRPEKIPEFIKSGLLRKIKKETPVTDGKNPNHIPTIGPAHHQHH